MKLTEITHPDDNPQLVKDACFYVGWHLKSPNSWEYIDIFTQKSDVVSIPKLIEAVQAKRDRLAGKEVCTPNYTKSSKSRR